MFNNKKKNKKNMYKPCKMSKTTLKNTPTDKGESIEEMIRRLTCDKQPIPQNVPPIYTERKDGVIPDYDIRADRYNVAMVAGDKFAASQIAKGANIPAPESVENNNNNNENKE